MSPHPHEEPTLANESAEAHLAVPNSPKEGRIHLSFVFALASTTVSHLVRNYSSLFFVHSVLVSSFLAIEGTLKYRHMHDTQQWV